MTKREKERFFVLARKLYAEMLKYNGTDLIVSAYLHDDESGELIAYAPNTKYSKRIMSALENA